MVSFSQVLSFGTFNILVRNCQHLQVQYQKSQYPLTQIKTKQNKLLAHILAKPRGRSDCNTDLFTFWVCFTGHWSPTRLHLVTCGPNSVEENVSSQQLPDKSLSSLCLNEPCAHPTSQYALFCSPALSSHSIAVPW